MIWFAEHVLGTPLDPWECWAAIHVGERLSDRRPRFRKVLIIVARQQGKTLLCRVLTLYWQFVERWPMILGTSTNLGYAKESWQAAVALAEATEDLAREIPSNGVRKAAGEECLSTVHGSRYRIAASNRKGGRSLTIDRLVLDELREHADWSAWGAAYNAMSARPEGQAVAITNQGDTTAVVLRSLRKDALKFIETGRGDHRLGLLEWSCEEHADPEDPHALAMANPNLGRRTLLDDLLADARRAKENGGEELATFKTEIMCIDVPLLAPALDAAKWGDCLDVGDLEQLRASVAACVDVAPGGQHATLVAAAVMLDGRVRVEVVKKWSGPDCLRQLRADLPKELARVKPRVFGWFPAGPAAAIAAALADRSKPGARVVGRVGRPVAWPPAGVTVEEIRQETTAVCMGFAEQVAARQVAHSDDPLLNAQVLGTEKLHQGEAWRFTRRGVGHCDATYAAAGAVHLARTLPPPDPPQRPKLITSKRHQSDGRT